MYRSDGEQAVLAPPCSQFFRGASICLLRSPYAIEVLQTEVRRNTEKESAAQSSPRVLESSVKFFSLVTPNVTVGHEHASRGRSHSISS